MVQKHHDPRAEELMSAIQSAMKEYNKYSKEFLKMEESEKVGAPEFWDEFGKANANLNKATTEFREYIARLHSSNADRVTRQFGKFFE